jgi:hypothetical protein
MNAETTLWAGKQLVTHKPKMTPAVHEFWLGEECVGKLVLPKAFGTLAEAESWATGGRSKGQGAGIPRLQSELREIWMTLCGRLFPRDGVGWSRFRIPTADCMN